MNREACAATAYAGRSPCGYRGGGRTLAPPLPRNRRHRRPHHPRGDAPRLDPGPEAGSPAAARAQGPRPTRSRGAAGDLLRALQPFRPEGRHTLTKAVHLAPRTPLGRPKTFGGTMRGYALLLGITLTIGYAYAGQVALTSVETANRHASLAGGADRAPDPLYYRGTPAPLTVDTPAATGRHH